MYGSLFLSGFRCIAVLFFSYFAAALCHELGHLLGAVRHGGSLLILRVGRLIFPGGKNRPWIWLGKWGGMSPGCCVVLCSGREGYIEAAAGGIRANLYASVLTVCAGAFEMAAGMPVSTGILLYRVIFAAVSLFMTLFNLLPVSESDGAVKRRLIRDDRYAEEFCAQQEKCLLLLENGLWEEVCFD